MIKNHPTLPGREGEAREASVSSRLPSAQNHPYDTVVDLEVAYSDLLHNPGKGEHSNHSSVLTWLSHEEHELQFEKG